MMIGEPTPIKVVMTNSKRTINGSIPDQFANPAQTPRIFLLALSMTKRVIILLPLFLFGRQYVPFKSAADEIAL